VAVIWVRCDQKILEERCDARVDTMMEDGMLKEMMDFHKEFNTSSSESLPRYTKGILQTIGFKEFHDYLLLDDSIDPGIRQKLFDEGVKEMKLRTRQYAKRQLKWINQRFLNGRARAGDLPRVYGVDSSRYPTGWDEDVHAPAVRVVQSYIDGTELVGIEPLPLNPNAHSFEDTRQTFNCTVCDIQVKGKIQLDAHMSSKKHKHEVKVAKCKSNAESNFKLVVTMVKKEAPDSGERNAGLLTIKNLTGLPLQEVNQLIRRTMEGTSGLDKGINSSCVQLPVVLRKFPPTTRAGIDRGNFDTSWLKIRTSEAPADQEEKRVNC